MAALHRHKAAIVRQPDFIFPYDMRIRFCAVFDFMRTKTTTLKNGTKVTKLVAANDNVPEWRLQAEACRQLRKLPSFNKRFAFAGDMAAAKRTRQGAAIAKATGLTPGEHDLRFYLEGGVLGLIEMKAGKGSLKPVQRDRHALLYRLGFTRQAVVKATTEADAASQVVSIVLGWLAANDNHRGEE